MSLEYIRTTYGVPAAFHGRVEYVARCDGEVLLGTILGAKNGRLRIRLDGNKVAGKFHPTYRLRYLWADGTTAWESPELTPNYK